MGADRHLTLLGGLGGTHLGNWPAFSGGQLRDGSTVGRNVLTLTRADPDGKLLDFGDDATQPWQRQAFSWPMPTVCGAARRRYDDILNWKTVTSMGVIAVLLVVSAALAV
jgi:hypothetical protein